MAAGWLQEEEAKIYSNLVDFSAMPVDSSYKGPRMEGGRLQPPPARPPAALPQSGGR